MRPGGKYEDWLRGLAAKGGKGAVDNIDARALGRVADELARLRHCMKGIMRADDETRKQLRLRAAAALDKDLVI